MVATSQSAEAADAPVSDESPRGAAPEPPAKVGWVGSVLRSGWPPALLVAVTAVTALLAFETPIDEVARYGAYLSYGLALPGTLLYRSLRGTPRSFVEDVAAGTVLGYAVELFVYFLVSWLGVPMLLAAWPALVIVAFLAVPRLRRHWRPTGAPRMPLGWSWSVAGMTAFGLAWLAWSGFLGHPLSGPGADSPYVDMPFHLALIGDLRHHFPPQIPWVTGEPASYHWFVHAHMAGSSWVTGIEPRTILLRLFAMPLAALTVLLTAILGSRISGRVWVGPVAAALYVVVGSFTPFAYAWFSPSFTDTSFLITTLWGSPTQTFGVTLFLPLLLLLSDRIRREPGGRGEWVIIALLLAATVGGKATFIPLLLGGVGLAGLIGLIARRRIDKPLIIAAGLGLAGFLYAQLILFGGASQGLLVEPFAITESIAEINVPQPPTWFRTFVFLIAILSWSARAAGFTGIFARRYRWLDPVSGVFLGIITAGLLATFTFSQSNGGQLYFIRSITPMIAVLSAWGAAQLLPVERATRRMALALFGAAVAGAAASAVVILWRDDTPPTARALGRDGVAYALVTPYLILLGVVAALGLTLVLLRRRHAVLRGVSAVLLIAFVFGLGGSRIIPAIRDPLRYIDLHGGLAYTKSDPAGRPIAAGALEAGRWLRGHSDVDDLVATNVHCRKEYKGYCDNRHFWMAAYSERRFLVESWGYTATANQGIPTYQGTWYYYPYWNPSLLADNDRLFADPTEANADLLKDKYGVRWLFVDDRFHRPGSALGEVADERFRSGDSIIYELR